MLRQIFDYIGNLFENRKTQKNTEYTNDNETKQTEDVSVFNNVNGELDEAIYQGEYGDCWLLSGLLSMSYTESGAAVIKESINTDSDGNVELSFDGINKEYTISAEELAAENKDISEKSNYSRGDDDALAIELGIEKLVSDPNVETKYSIKDGGHPYYVYKLYNAESIEVADDKTEIANAFEYFKENSDDCSMSLGVLDESICGLKTNHGYAVKEVTTSSVVIVDPWNSEETISVDKKTLLKNADNLNVVYAEFAMQAN